MYKVTENRKSTEWLYTEISHLTVKSCPYTLNTYPWGPKFGPFRSTISRFRDTTCTRWPKIRNAPNDPELNLSTWQSKVLYIHLELTHEVRKIGNAPNDPNWTWRPNSQKYSKYTKYLPLRSKFSFVSLYDYPFPRYKVVKNRKCTEWPQTELEHLTVKSTLYTLNTHPWRPESHHNSHHLALTATQNVLSYTLSLGPHYEKSQVHEWLQNNLER